MTEYDFCSLPAKAIQVAKDTIEALKAPSAPVIRRYELSVFGNTISIGDDDYLIGQRYGRRKSPDLFAQPVAGYAPALYCFALQNLEDAMRVRESRRALEGSINDRKLSEDNTKHRNGTCLYVGSSVGPASHVGSRLSQHLGFTGGSGTYALYLNLLPLSTPLMLELSIAWYPGNTPEFVQRLEEAMWDDLTPLYGRRGR